MVVWLFTRDWFALHCYPFTFCVSVTVPRSGLRTVYRLHTADCYYLRTHAPFSCCCGSALHPFGLPRLRAITVYAGCLPHFYVAHPFDYDFAFVRWNICVTVFTPRYVLFADSPVVYVHALRSFFSRIAFTVVLITLVCVTFWLFAGYGLHAFAFAFTVDVDVCYVVTVCY